MAAELKEQLAMIINSMYQENLLDGQFEQLQMLQDESNPTFVMEVLSLYVNQSNRTFTELEKTVSTKPVIDFHEIGNYVHRLKGSSASVGACKLKMACIEFRQCLERDDREECLRALNAVKHEYLFLRNKFQAMIQLEERIQAAENKKE